jgi:hypothetical protein
MPRTNFHSIVVATLFSLLASVPAFSDSQVRIVRLSYVDGSVQISRDHAAKRRQQPRGS